MILYDVNDEKDLKLLAGLQWLAILGMVADHCLRGLQALGGFYLGLGLFGITLPVMGLCVGLFAEKTDSDWFYLFRLLSVGVLSQIPYLYSGVGGDQLNDVLGLCLGLSCVMIEKKYKYFGISLCLILGSLVGLAVHVFMVYLAWEYRDRQEVYCYGVGVMGLCMMVFDVRFIAWTLGAVIIYGWSVRGLGLRKLGRTMYYLYPMHLALIGVMKGVLK